MKDIENFLIINNFKKVGDWHFVNENCEIEIDDLHYTVTDNEGCAMYSNDLNIYWLIGVLTYYGYMDKNYTELK